MLETLKRWFGVHKVERNYWNINDPENGEHDPWSGSAAP